MQFEPDVYTHVFHSWRQMQSGHSIKIDTLTIENVALSFHESVHLQGYDSNVIELSHDVECLSSKLGSIDYMAELDRELMNVKTISLSTLCGLATSRSSLHVQLTAAIIFGCACNDHTISYIIMVWPQVIIVLISACEASYDYFRVARPISWENNTTSTLHNVWTLLDGCFGNRHRALCGIYVHVRR